MAGTVLEDESIFTYFGAMDWQTFEDKTFIPNFIPSFPDNVNHNITDKMLEDKCNKTEFCTFDYMTTLSAAIAESSLGVEAWAMQSQAMIAHGKVFLNVTSIPEVSLGADAWVFGSRAIMRV